jgi:(E)-4-hydroxy-3-methylbut-2-enyl-diphosphate synthase
MTNTSTMDTEESIYQCIRIIDAGADYVRLTAQGVREAENLRHISAGLRKKGFRTPLVADIHFNHKAAEAAALHVEKVRINPGNFVNPVKTLSKSGYTDDEYEAELKKIRDRLLSLIDICRQHHTAIRIGVNHGSLSERIMSRYGDTPAGMVESCMEFLHILAGENFRDVVVSLKSSHTMMMVKTVHHLIKRMDAEGMHFPLHLGVTEAGDADEGRIKSAVGIGALLVDGIGDTIRVSLSEDPEVEIPIARKLVDYAQKRNCNLPLKAAVYPDYDPASLERRETYSIGNIGGDNVPVAIANLTTNPVGDFDWSFLILCADYLYVGDDPMDYRSACYQQIVDFPAWKNQEYTYPLFDTSIIDDIAACESKIKFLRLTCSECSEEIIRLLQSDSSLVVILETSHVNGLGEQRAFFHTLLNNGCRTPVIAHREYRESNRENLQLKASVDLGTLLIDGFRDGIMLSNEGRISSPTLHYCMFGILQATRLRVSKTEYISCPGCGRTLFNMRSTLSRVKKATAHLKRLKIGVMGCIVNGPGEMADADYGYVGSGRGKIDLYKGKQCMEKNIPEELAVEKLLELIRENGDWREEW